MLSTKLIRRNADLSSFIIHPLSAKLPPRPACTSHRARRTALATATAFHFFGAATRAAAFDERFGKLAKLNVGLVGLGKLARVRFQIGRHIAQKIKEEPLAIEQMLDIDEHSRHVVFHQHRGASCVSFLAILFQPGLQQLVLNGHAAKQLAVGKYAAVVAIVGRAEYLAELQSTTRAYDHAAATRIAYRINRRKSADLAHRPNSN